MGAAAGGAEPWLDAGVRGAKSREVLEAHQASFRYAVEQGVKIAMGTDMGVGPHGPNAEELELMVKNGLTPMQAIVAVTRNAAECGRFAEAGIAGGGDARGHPRNRW